MATTDELRNAVARLTNSVASAEARVVAKIDDLQSSPADVPQDVVDEVNAAADSLDQLVPADLT